MLSQYTLLSPSILVIYRITHNSLSCRGIICPLSCVLGPNYWVKSLIILLWNQDYADIVKDKYKHLRSKILLQFGKLSQLTERNQENCAKKYVYGQYWDFLSKIIWKSLNKRCLKFWKHADSSEFHFTYFPHLPKKKQSYAQILPTFKQKPPCNSYLHFHAVKNM